MEITLDLPPSLTARFAALGYPDPLDGLQDAAKLLLGLGPDAWATITASAEALGTTPAKYILAKLSETPAAQPEAPAKAPKKRQSNEARDAQIAGEYFAGTVTYPVLAVKYGLSVVRIVQIVAKARAQRAASNTTI
jgi:hypothetical protein